MEEFSSVDRSTILRRCSNININTAVDINIFWIKQIWTHNINEATSSKRPYFARISSTTMLLHVSGTPQKLTILACLFSFTKLIWNVTKCFPVGYAILKISSTFISVWDLVLNHVNISITLMTTYIAIFLSISEFN